MPVSQPMQITNKPTNANQPSHSTRTIQSCKFIFALFVSSTGYVYYKSFRTLPPTNIFLLWLSKHAKTRRSYWWPLSDLVILFNMKRQWPNLLQICKCIFPLHSNMCAISPAFFPTITMLHSSSGCTFSTRRALGLYKRETWESCYIINSKNVHSQCKK